MSPRASLTLFLCLIAATGASFGAQSQCKYADQRQQQACLNAEAQRQQQQMPQLQAQQRQQQEAQRQAQLRQQQLQQQQTQQRQSEQQAQQQRAQEQARQAEDKRQQQLQQQQALQRQQEQQRAKATPTPAPQVAPANPSPTPVKTTSAPTQAVSRTAGMTPVTLGNGQQVFVNSQGAFFDASGNPISNQSIATATKGTPAITPAPPSQVVPPKSAPTAAPMGTVGSASSRVQISNNGLNSNSQQSTVQSQTAKTPVGFSTSAPQTPSQVPPGSASTSGAVIGSAANRALSVTSTSATNTASTTPPQISGNANAANSSAGATGSASTRAGLVDSNSGRMVTNPLQPQTANSILSTLIVPPNRSVLDGPKSSQPSSNVGPLSAKELETYSIEKLASMPKEQLANLSADRRKHLDIYISAKADASKYEAEANRSMASRVVQELPRQTANVTAGAAVGTGQVVVETGKAAFDAGQRVGNAIVHPVTTTRKIEEEAEAIRANPAEGARQVGTAIGGVATQATQAVSSGAVSYLDAVKRGDGYEAGRVVGRATATGALAIEGAPSGKAASEVAGTLLRGGEREAATQAPTVGRAINQIAKTDAKPNSKLINDSAASTNPQGPLPQNALPRSGNRLVLNQGRLPTCGATSCAMVLDTAGKKVDLNKLIIDSETKLGPPGPVGAEMEKLAIALQKNGIRDARVERPDLEQLSQATASGRPAIVRLRGTSIDHAVVVDGVTLRQGQEVVAIRDPARGQYFLPVEEFKKSYGNEAILTK